MTTQFSGGSRTDLTLIGIEGVSIIFIILSVAICYDEPHRVFKAE